MKFHRASQLSHLHLGFCTFVLHFWLWCWALITGSGSWESGCMRLSMWEESFVFELAQWLINPFHSQSSENRWLSGAASRWVLAADPLPKRLSWGITKFSSRLSSTCGRIKMQTCHMQIWVCRVHSLSKFYSQDSQMTNKPIQMQRMKINSKIRNVYNLSSSQFFILCFVNFNVNSWVLNTSV